jgi:hypothetical protein
MMVAITPGFLNGGIAEPVVYAVGPMKVRRKFSSKSVTILAEAHERNCAYVPVCVPVDGCGQTTVVSGGTGTVYVGPPTDIGIHDNSAV